MGRSAQPRAGIAGPPLAPATPATPAVAAESEPGPTLAPSPVLVAPSPPDARPAPAADSDEAFMLAYTRGDASAFRTLVARYSDRVYHFILRQVRLPETANELVQETFLRVVKNASGFRADARFSTWVFTIARNLSVDAQRRQKHRNTVPLDAPLRRDEADGASMIDVVRGDDRPQDSKLDDRRFSHALREALDSLPPEQREVFLLRELEGLKFREIADIVGTPENTVKSRMRYALEALRQRLSAYAPPP